MPKAPTFSQLNKAIIDCNRCPRLRRHCLTIAREKRKAFAAETYWGRPIPGFGDPKARLIIIGLAPAAHGANRTGRVFTGDRSGDWLYRALYKANFANQHTSTYKDDGLTLTDAFITATVKCAPPDNKPTPAEITRCLPYLETELELLHCGRVYLALGKLAWDQAWGVFKTKTWARGKRPEFKHGAAIPLEQGRWLLSSYHPSQQNTFTGKLTEPMFDSVFAKARTLLT